MDLSKALTAFHMTCLFRNYMRIVKKDSIVFFYSYLSGISKMSK